MNYFFLILCFLLINFFVVVFFDKIKLFKYAIDYPDKSRKFHKKPTALAGGTILIVNLLFYVLLVSFDEKYLDKILFENNYEFILFLSSAFLIYLIGLYDDKFNLNPIKKFILLIFIISLFTYFNDNTQINEIIVSFHKTKLSIENFSIIFTIFCYLVFINAFNMFDGINLQSASYTMIVLLFIVLNYHFSFIFFILIIYLIFFLYLNFKNKSFLGDNGSLLIPFLIGFFFIKLYNNGIIKNTDEIFIFMIVPGIDMVRLFFERIMNKRNPLSFDRNHLHHLLIKKKSFQITTFTIILFILMPIIISNFVYNKLYVILLFILLYGFTIKTLKD